MSAEPVFPNGVSPRPTAVVCCPGPSLPVWAEESVTSDLKASSRSPVHRPPHPSKEGRKGAPPRLGSGCADPSRGHGGHRTESQAGPGPGEAWPRFCLVTAGGPGQSTTLSEPHRCGGWTLTHGGPLVCVHAFWTGHRGKGLGLCQLWGLGHRGRPLSSTAPQKASCTPRSRPWAASVPGRSSRPLPSPRGSLLLWGSPFLYHTRAKRPGHLQSRSTGLCLVSHASSEKSSWCPHPRPLPLPPERCRRRCWWRKRQHLAAWEDRGRVPSVRSVTRQARPASQQTASPAVRQEDTPALPCMSGAVTAADRGPGDTCSLVGPVPSFPVRVAR